MPNPYSPPSLLSETDEVQSPKDPVLPGLGIACGIFIGVIAWELRVEDAMPRTPRLAWLAQGCFYTACVVVCSLIDGLVRSNGLAWKPRIFMTLRVALALLLSWGFASVGAAWGKPIAVAGWILGLAVSTGLERLVFAKSAEILKSEEAH